MNLADYRHPRAVRRTLAALAPIACPPEIEEFELVDEVVDHMELSMGALPAVARGGLVAGLTAFEHAARLWPPGRGRRFSKLSRELALRYFLAWRHGTRLQHEFIKGTKGLLCLGYYEMPAAKQSIGYTPEAWIETVTRRRLEVYSDAIEQHAASIVAPDPLPARGDMLTTSDDSRRQEAS